MFNKKSDKSKMGDIDRPYNFQIIRRSTTTKVNKERDNRVQAATFVSMIVCYILIGSVTFNVYQSIAHGGYVFYAQDIRTGELTEPIVVLASQLESDVKIGPAPIFTEDQLVKADKDRKARSAWLNSVQDDESRSMLIAQLNAVQGKGAVPASPTPMMGPPGAQRRVMQEYLLPLPPMVDEESVALEASKANKASVAGQASVAKEATKVVQKENDTPASTGTFTATSPGVVEAKQNSATEQSLSSTKSATTSTTAPTTAPTTSAQGNQAGAASQSGTAAQAGQASQALEASKAMPSSQTATSQSTAAEKNKAAQEIQDALSSQPKKASIAQPASKANPASIPNEASKAQEATQPEPASVANRSSSANSSTSKR